MRSLSLKSWRKFSKLRCRMIAFCFDNLASKIFSRRNVFRELIECSEKEAVSQKKEEKNDIKMKINRKVELNLLRDALLFPIVFGGIVPYLEFPVAISYSRLFLSVSFLFRFIRHVFLFLFHISLSFFSPSSTFPFFEKKMLLINLFLLRA